MASVLLLVMTVIFMLLKCATSLTKCVSLDDHRFTSQIHRTLKAFALSALKRYYQFMDRCHRLAGLELMGVQFALMWAVLAFLLTTCPISARYFPPYRQ
ncbi:hypothetical protein ACLK1T_14230 [Escherichia coli]